MYVGGNAKQRRLEKESSGIRLSNLFKSSKLKTFSVCKWTSHFGMFTQNASFCSHPHPRMAWSLKIEIVSELEMGIGLQLLRQGESWAEAVPNRVELHVGVAL